MQLSIATEPQLNHHKNAPIRIAHATTTEAIQYNNTNNTEEGPRTERDAHGVNEADSEMHRHRSNSARMYDEREQSTETRLRFAPAAALFTAFCFVSRLHVHLLRVRRHRFLSRNRSLFPRLSVGCCCDWCSWSADTTVTANDLGRVNVNRPPLWLAASSVASRSCPTRVGVDRADDAADPRSAH
jgi:hypothetical protein